MSGISTNDIRAGDTVTVSQGFNRLRGQLSFDARLNLCVEAFGQSLVILKRSPGNRNTLVAGIKIEDHQPQLF